MKLLFDQNLSPRLSQILTEDFPDSKHVLDLGLDQTPDLDLWKFARDSGYCIVSKDSDFGDWAQVFGSPPPLVWLRVGNCKTRDLVTKLSRNAERIHSLGAKGNAWVLVIS